MKKLFHWVLILLLIGGGIIWGCIPVLADDSTDESQLFSGTDTVVSQDQVVNDNAGNELKIKQIGVTGEFDSYTYYYRFDPAYLFTGLGGDPEKLMSQATDQLMNLETAYLFTDIRLQNGIKGFLSTELDYYPALTSATAIDSGLNTSNLTNNGTSYSYTSPLEINEFFIDTNWKNKVYFQTGKQVLQWGTGYFWNPTDLINISHKDFFNMDKVREGTFGEKITIPSGANQTTYFFIGMNDATTTDDVTLAGKYEFLVGKTEMSVSTLLRKGYEPVYGYDFSSRLGLTDLRGELSLTPGADETILDYDSLTPLSQDGWIPRASLGFTRFFDNGPNKNAISLTGEFYYNGNGYNQNILQRIAQNMQANPLINLPQNINFLENYYQPFMNSEYYFALFSSVAKFLTPEITLNINGIGNLVDHSSILNAGISYTPTVIHFTIELNCYDYIGAPYSEATMEGNQFSAYLGLKIQF